MGKSSAAVATILVACFTVGIFDSVVGKIVTGVGGLPPAAERSVEQDSKPMDQVVDNSVESAGEAADNAKYDRHAHSLSSEPFAAR